MTKYYRPTCTACGKEGNQILERSTKLKKDPSAYSVSDKCTKTENGKHIIIWKEQ